MAIDLLKTTKFFSQFASATYLFISCFLSINAAFIYRFWCVTTNGRVRVLSRRAKWLMFGSINLFSIIMAASGFQTWQEKSVSRKKKRFNCTESKLILAVR
jgi:hypothetical protein